MANNFLSNFTQEQLNKINHFVNLCFEGLKSANYKVVTAESITAGLISYFLTSRPNASLIFERGFTVYNNYTKSQLLSIDLEFIERNNAVSEEVAIEMAIGALKNSNADIALAITGFAGPDDDQVGLVYIALGSKDNIKAFKFNFNGTRNEIRVEAAIKALELLSALFGLFVTS